MQNNESEIIRQPFTIPLVLVLAVALWNCASPTPGSEERPEPTTQKRILRMRHTVQVGAFASMNNAVRFTAKLQKQGINAYHFRHESGLYKVRFGNYATREIARSRAESLKAAGLIEAYYLIGPQDFVALSGRSDNNEYLRREIVRTAKRYIGVPYRWGGESPQTGFDCSGLTMVVYRLNGLDLPRSSRQQWRAGTAVKRGQLAKGDLVFFATSGGTKVSHVGIYTGDNKFLHAPSKGRKIRISSLTSNYYRTRYVGARTYL